MNKRQRLFFGIGAWAREAALFRLMTTYQKDVGAGMLRTTKRSRPDVVVFPQF